MPRRLGQAPLVGRLAETSALDEALRISAEGTEGGPVAVVFAGDAGIGKSRLAAEMSSRAAIAGWQVLSAGCVDLAEGSVPYLPLVDALRGLPMKSSQRSSNTGAAARLSRPGPSCRRTWLGVGFLRPTSICFVPVAMMPR